MLPARIKLNLLGSIYVRRFVVERPLNVTVMTRGNQTMTIRVLVTWSSPKRVIDFGSTRLIKWTIRHGLRRASLRDGVVGHPGARVSRPVGAEA